MNKLLIALTATGLLALPAGAAFAQGTPSDPSGTSATTETTVTCDRDRDGDCLGAQGQAAAQDQTRDRLHDGTCDGTSQGTGNGTQARSGDRAGLGDGTGTMRPGGHADAAGATGTHGRRNG